MKKSPLYLLTIILVCLFLNSYSQSTIPQSFFVPGNLNTYYPVAFSENYDDWKAGATEFEISRSDVHIDASWKGSVIAKFRVHTSDYGNRSNFIDADIRSFIDPFVADWIDATNTGGNQIVLVWLKGNTTYNFRSTNSRMQLPTAYINGFQEPNGGPLRLPVAKVRDGLNSNGLNLGGDVTVCGTGVFQGNLLVGKSTQINSAYKLDVAGTVRANEVVVNSTGADFVFQPDYKLRPLAEVDSFIQQNKHLPEIKSASEMQADGMSVSELNTKLLQKVEELTLYIIQQAKEQEQLRKEFEEYKKQNKK